jgi:hypothetical protein
MSKTAALLVLVTTLLSATAAAATELRVMSFNICTPSAPMEQI